MQVEQRQLANPKKAGEEPYKPLAPVLDNSIAWGGFVAASTNLRYQLVNGIEERGLVSSSRLCGAPCLLSGATPSAGKGVYSFSSNYPHKKLKCVSRTRS